MSLLNRFAAAVAISASAGFIVVGVPSLVVGTLEGLASHRLSVADSILAALKLGLLGAFIAGVAGTPFALFALTVILRGFSPWRVYLPLVFGACCGLAASLPIAPEVGAIAVKVGVDGFAGVLIAWIAGAALGGFLASAVVVRLWVREPIKPA